MLKYLLHKKIIKNEFCIFNIGFQLSYQIAVLTYIFQNVFVGKVLVGYF